MAGSARLRTGAMGKNQATTAKTSNGCTNKFCLKKPGENQKPWKFQLIDTDWSPFSWLQRFLKKRHECYKVPDFKGSVSWTEDSKCPPAISSQCSGWFFPMFQGLTLSSRHFQVSLPILQVTPWSQRLRLGLATNIHWSWEWCLTNDASALPPQEHRLSTSRKLMETVWVDQPICFALFRALLSKLTRLTSKISVALGGIFGSNWQVNKLWQTNTNNPSWSP